ncbi:MAG: DUF2442 domain-containing protein [Bacteroidales bacterium]|nr:DUF2442 domain-containing protein [Bacteroidales bacterium]
MKIIRIWFDGEMLWGEGTDGKLYSQSLLWYPSLMKATESERSEYECGFDGFHWRKLDEDVSFESFLYPDAQPSPLQRYFLENRGMDLRPIAIKAGITIGELKRIINGNSTPSPTVEQKINRAIYNA